MSHEPFPLDAEAIRELARLLEETGLVEIEVEDAGRKLRVVRGQDSVSAFPLPQAAVHPPEAAHAAHPRKLPRKPLARVPFAHRWSAPPIWRLNPVRPPS